MQALQEGAAEPLALLGLIRLVRHLSGPTALGRAPCHLITDCGTGTTAVGKQNIIFPLSWVPDLQIYSPTRPGCD